MEMVLLGCRVKVRVPERRAGDPQARERAARLRRCGRCGGWGFKLLPQEAGETVQWLECQHCRACEEM